MNIDKSKTIEKYFVKTGRLITAVNSGKETKFYGVIRPTWKRLKSRFEPYSTEVGRYYHNYFQLLCPASLGMGSFSDDDYFLIDGDKYYLVQFEDVKVGDVLQYYRIILKKEEEGDADVFIK